MGPPALIQSGGRRLMRLEANRFFKPRNRFVREYQELAKKDPLSPQNDVGNARLFGGKRQFRRIRSLIRSVVDDNRPFGAS